MLGQELTAKANSFVSRIYYDAFLRFYNRMFGRPVPSKFMVIGFARTGSNYLIDGLKSSNSVVTYPEIFADHNRTSGKDIEKVLSTLYQNEHRGARLVGAKIFYNHLTEEEWHKFAAHDEFQIIHLTRANKLRTIVSLDVAFKTDEWTRSRFVRKTPLAKRRISLDTFRLLGRLEAIRTQESLTRKRFAARPVHEVIYEEMVADPQKIFRGVGNFLGVTDIDYTTIKITKQNPEPLHQLVVNFDEVRQLLINTEFAGYLDG